MGACGDDDTKCGAGTVEQNGQCVAVPTNTTDATTSTSPSDTSNPTSSTNPTDATSGTTSQSDTSTQLDTSGECSPGEAGQGTVGSPCTKDCQCNQNFNGSALFCYSGVYMPGHAGVILPSGETHVISV